MSSSMWSCLCKRFVASKFLQVLLLRRGYLFWGLLINTPTNPGSGSHGGALVAGALPSVPHCRRQLCMLAVSAASAMRTCHGQIEASIFVP